MLTGDKLETATCTAKNAHLITRNQDIHIFRPVSAGRRPLFLLHAHEVGYSRFLVPQGSQFSAEPTVSWLRRPAGVHPLCDPGHKRAVAAACRRNYARSCEQQQQQQHRRPQLNKSPPNSGRIQAAVKENKRGSAQNPRRGQLNPLPEGARAGLHFLICFAGFWTLSSLW